MSADKININVAHLGVPLDVSQPESIHPVGVSHLSEYFTTLYGREMPQGEREQALATSLYEAMSAISTDERLARLAQHNPRSYAPYWLRLAHPLIETTTAVGQYVEERISAIAQELENPTPEDDTTETQAAGQDFMFMLGLYDIATFVVAGYLQVPHPRLDNQQLVERATQLTSPDHVFLGNERLGSSKTPIEQLRDLVLPRHRAEITRILNAGRDLVAKSEEYALTVIEWLRSAARTDKED